MTEVNSYQALPGLCIEPNGLFRDKSGNLVQSFDKKQRPIEYINEYVDTRLEDENYLKTLLENRLKDNKTFSLSLQSEEVTIPVTEKFEVKQKENNNVLYKRFGIKSIEIVERYSENDIKINKDKIYVFGDNVKRIGTGGQAIIRNNVNAVGIATKLAPSNDESAFMSDNDFEKNKEIIDKDIDKLIDKSDEKIIVFPKDGLGTGLAKLKEKAPETYQYLKEQLLNNFGFNNDTGELYVIQEENLGLNINTTQEEFKCKI